MPTLNFHGGLNEQDDFNVDINECIEGQNYKLDRVAGSFRPRDPQDLLTTAPNTSDIRGIMQLITSAGVESTIYQAGDDVYSWDGTDVGDCDASSKLRGTLWQLDDMLIITDITLSTVIKSWDGSSFSTLTTGIGSDVFAKYGIVKDGRVWLFNIKIGSTATPHGILVSAFEDQESYDNTKRAGDGTFTTGNEAFLLVAKDGKAINGVATFFDDVVFSTEDGKLYRLTGSDSTNYAVADYYSGSAATGSETMVNVGNDLVYMKDGGRIDSLRATDSSGDVSADDVSRWIPDTTDGVTDGISVYDQQRQLIYWFISGCVLVLNKDLLVASNLSPWSVYKTKMGNAFNANAAFYGRKPGSTDKIVMWGDSNGKIYNMYGTGVSGDDGTYTVQTKRKSRLITEQDTLNDIIKGRVEYRRKGIFNLQADFEWSEDYSITTTSIPMKGPIVSAGTAFWGSSSDPIYFGESHYWGEGGVDSERVSTVGFTPTGKAPSFFITLSADTNINFLINKIYESERA